MSIFNGKNPFKTFEMTEDQKAIRAIEQDITDTANQAIVPEHVARELTRRVHVLLNKEMTVARAEAIADMLGNIACIEQRLDSKEK